MKAETDSINVIDNELVEEFLAANGKAYVNTLNSGGGYVFLLNKVLKHPILIINVLNYKSLINAKLIMVNKEVNFYCKNINELINKFQLKEICINHLIWANNFSEIFNEIVDVCKLIDLDIYIHDFFTVCPTVNLLNYNGQYCGVPSYTECAKCINVYPNSTNATKFASKQMELYTNELYGDIRNWRNLWQKIFNQARSIIVPSHSTAEIFNRAYNNQYQEKVVIRPHPVNEFNKIKQKNKISKNSFMNVYLLGYIDEHKGSRILKALIDKTVTANLNICYNVLGWFDYPEYEYSPFLKLHGAYKPEELARLLNESEIDMFIQPSICPETFSYVIHEMKATGLPILVFNLGAQVEFLVNYKPAIFADQVSPDAMFNEITRLYDIHMKNLYPLLYTDSLGNEGINFACLLQKKSLEVAKNHCLMIREVSVKNQIIESQVLELVVKNQIIEAQNQEIVAKNVQLDNLGNTIKMLENSRSWKITYPMRRLGAIIRRLRNKMKKN